MIPHSYKITNLITNQCYIGVCLKSNYKERFLVHMEGNGSSAIACEMIEHNYTKNDYKIEVLKYYTDSISALEDEGKLIRKYDSVNNGLNRNYGGGFSGFDAGKLLKHKYGYCDKLYRQKQDKESFANKLFLSIDKRGLYTDNVHMGQIIYRINLLEKLLSKYDAWKNCYNIIKYYKLIRKAKINYNFFKVLDECKYLNHNTKNEIIKLILYENNRKEFKWVILKYIKHNKNMVCPLQRRNSIKMYDYELGISKEDELYSLKMSMINKYIQKSNPTLTDGWKRGRKKFKERMLKGIYTEKEKERMSNISSLVKKDWEKLSKDEREKKFKPGLDKMNAKNITCPHCNKSGLTAGNAKRWHFDNCKMKGQYKL